MDIYKFAAQNKLRFPTDRGELTVEQLFSLPLKSQGGFDLDTTARGISNALKECSQESFVEEPTADPRRAALEVSLEIVKDVIKTKQEANAAELAKVKRQAERAKILDAIETKEGEALTKASLKDLKKKLAELD